MDNECWKCRKKFSSEEVDTEETVGLCEACFEHYGVKEVDEPAIVAAGPPTASNSIVVAGPPTASNSTIHADFGAQEVKDLMTAGLEETEARGAAVTVGLLEARLFNTIMDFNNELAVGRIAQESAGDVLLERLAKVLIENLPVGAPVPPVEAIKLLVSETLQEYQLQHPDSGIQTVSI